ncbi:MAG: zonular occludens toxin domain-containing protein [Desulfobacteraceae bacterium]|nr:zonular occludens toxin domain-containing protein [Desulfobacteraceae bacterium]
MIVLYTGNPRSGKSYRMVYEMLQPGVQDKYFIIHDIDGLKHEKFHNPGMLRQVDDVCKDSGISRAQFLTNEFQEKLYAAVLEKYERNILLVLDECHMSNRSNLGVKNVTARDFLAYHGHYGQEVWLATQNRNMLHTDFRGLVGYQIHAKKGAVIPFFVYSHMDGAGVSVGGKRLPKKQEVFDCYKSFHIAEARQRKSMLLPLAGVAVLIAIAVLVWYFRNPFGDKGNNVAVSHASTAPPAAAPKVDARKEKKPKGTAELLAGYRFAAFMGGRVYLQAVDGGSLICLDEILDKFQVLEVQGRVVLIRHKGEFYRILSRRVGVPEPRGREGGTHGAGTEAQGTRAGT